TYPKTAKIAPLFLTSLRCNIAIIIDHIGIKPPDRLIATRKRRQVENAPPLVWRECSAVNHLHEPEFRLHACKRQAGRIEDDAISKAALPPGKQLARELLRHLLSQRSNFGLKIGQPFIFVVVGLDN